MLRFMPVQVFFFIDIRNVFDVEIGQVYENYQTKNKMDTHVVIAAIVLLIIKGIYLV